LGDIAWNPDIDNTNEITRIIYGLDADLILLSMLNIRDGVHCYLMREE
jgi:5'-3' exonuclease